MPLLMEHAVKIGQLAHYIHYHDSFACAYLAYVEQMRVRRQWRYQHGAAFYHHALLRSLLHQPAAASHPEVQDMR